MCQLLERFKGLNQHRLRSRLRFACLLKMLAQQSISRHTTPPSMQVVETDGTDETDLGHSARLPNPIHTCDTGLAVWLSACFLLSDPCSLLFISPVPDSTLWILSHSARAPCPCPMEAVRNVASCSILCQGGREAVKRSTLRRPPQQVGCIVYSLA